jgi:predicted DNA-binding protein (MmcQ/YjbR family)
MDVEWLRHHCLSFPGASEHVQWGEHLVFKVAGKIFAVLALEPGGQFLMFKSTPEEAADLVERPGVIPAPYLARAHWVALETEDALSPAEIRRLVSRSYELVVEKLPKAKRPRTRGKA